MEITSLDDLKLYINDPVARKLNPLEKYFALRLLLEDIFFVIQDKIDVPDGWKIEGKTYFVVDFYLPLYNLIIETEGKIHDQKSVKDYDRVRFNTLAAMGYSIMRFNWDDVFNPTEDYDILYFVKYFAKQEDDRIEDFKKTLDKKKKKDPTIPAGASGSGNEPL